MDKAEQLKFRRDLSIFAQTLAFYIFGTAGMFAIATALLAGPVVRFYHDQRVLEIQEYKVSKLTERRDQQQELLGNLDNEAIVKRAARMNLNYVSSAQEIISEQIDSMRNSWPDLTDAVLRACDDFPKEPPQTSWQKYCQAMTRHTSEKTALILIGGLLISVSLTCFASSKKTGNYNQQ